MEVLSWGYTWIIYLVYSLIVATIVEFFLHIFSTLDLSETRCLLKCTVHTVNWGIICYAQIYFSKIKHPNCMKTDISRYDGTEYRHNAWTIVAAPHAYSSQLSQWVN